MAWDGTGPDIGEARLDAIHDLLVANLSSLNTTLQRGSLWPSSVAITSANVTIGDPETFPANTPVLICVCGTLEGWAQEWEAGQRFLDNSSLINGIENTITTHVLSYIHPDAIQGDLLTQAANRERVNARIAGWMRAGVFNLAANRRITLGSREYNAAPNYDTLDKCIATMGYKGYFEKSFGKSTLVYGAHVVHTGFVKG